MEVSSSEEMAWKGAGAPGNLAGRRAVRTARTDSNPVSLGRVRLCCCQRAATSEAAIHGPRSPASSTIRAAELLLMAFASHLVRVRNPLKQPLNQAQGDKLAKFQALAF